MLPTISSTLRAAMKKIMDIVDGKQFQSCLGLHHSRCAAVEQCQDHAAAPYIQEQVPLRDLGDPGSHTTSNESCLHLILLQIDS